MSTGMTNARLVLIVLATAVTTAGLSVLATAVLARQQAMLDALQACAMMLGGR